jgi:hypothetical protein
LDFLPDGEAVTQGDGSVQYQPHGKRSRGRLPAAMRETRYFMRQVSKVLLVASSAVALLAADPSWPNKPTQQWNVEDAKQVLASSPWVGKVAVKVVPQRTEAQQREGGKMGGGEGAGIAAFTPSTLFGVGATPEPGKRRARMAAVEVRWESAPPVRAAEQTLHDTDAPDWEGSYYVIAIYDVPGIDISDRSLAGNLKRMAALRRDGKKPVRPERVDCLPQVGGLATIVYLFPRSAEITLEDKRVEFDAWFGRLSVAQSFYPTAMQYQGKLDL